MGTLPRYLQHAFAAACPPGWSAASEVVLLSDDFAVLLGYRPQADLVLTHDDGRRIWDVLLNLRRWERDLAEPSTQALWGRRTVTYFVAEPRSGRFAPSKFCTFVDVTAQTPDVAMTVARYVTLDGQAPRFDGHRARMHLTRHLAFVERPLSEVTALQPAFNRWLRVHQDAITLHPRGPILLLPPPWYSA